MILHNFGYCRDWKMKCELCASFANQPFILGLVYAEKAITRFVYCFFFFIVWFICRSLFALQLCHFVVLIIWLLYHELKKFAHSACPYCYMSPLFPIGDRCICDLVCYVLFITLCICIAYSLCTSQDVIDARVFAFALYKRKIVKLEKRGPRLWERAQNQHKEEAQAKSEHSQIFQWIAYKSQYVQ